MHDLSALFKAPHTVAIKEGCVLKQSLHVRFRMTPHHTHFLIFLFSVVYSRKLTYLAFREMLRKTYTWTDIAQGTLVI